MKNINQKGFTLIELVIVMAIVGILSVIVFDTFSSQARANRRTEAKNILFEVMQRQEKYMSENNTYTTDLSDLGYSAASFDTENEFYNISAEETDNGIADGVILTATAQNAQLKDTECGDFILNSNGQKTTSTEATEHCW